MEQPLIVLLDVESGMVNLFGAFNKQISVHDLHIIRPFLEDRPIIWIVDAVESTSEDVLPLIEAVAESHPQANREPMYVRSISDGYIRINDIKGLRFSGPKDCKPLDKLGYDVFEKSRHMKKLLIEGKIEILTETEARNIRKPVGDLAKARDKQLDSILLDHHTQAEDIDNIFPDDDAEDSDEEIITDAEAMVKKGYGRDE